MSARTVAVRLTAEVGSYLQGIDNAKRATKDLTSATLDTAAKNKAAFDQVGRGMLAFGATAGLAVAGSVAQFAEFDAAMSGVQAATHESAAAMDDLRAAALEAGARTAFSATEAADGIEQLAKAGVSTEAILNGGLNGALDLAAAGALDVGDAAEIAATAMTQFKLEGDQVPRVADLLAAAAGKAQGEVSDFGQALKQSGLVAAQTGLSIEETTAGLAAFASAGLLGSDAGTSLKTMLQRLTPTSEEAAGAMQELGFSAYDSQGNFIGLEALAREMQTSFQDLTVEQRNLAMSTIFGSDAVRAASVLYEQGAEGVAAWTEKVDDAGYAQETASIKLDNLKGDIEAFMGSVETAMIKTGAAGDGLARNAVQTATSVVNAYGELPGAAQSLALGVGGFVAVAGSAASAFLLLAPRIAETRTALATLNTEMPRATAAMSALGKAAAIATVVAGTAIAIDQLSGALAGTPPGVNALTDSLADFARTGKVSGELAQIVGQDFADLAEKMEQASKNRGLEFINIFSQTDVITIQKAREEMEALDAMLASLVTSGNADAAADFLAESGVSAEQSAKHFTAYTEATKGLAAEAKFAALEQEGLVGATEAAGEAAGVSAEETKAAADALKELADISGEFIAPLGAYTEALAAKQEVERQAAEATAAATESATDSWEDFATDVTLSIGEYLTELEKQVAAQDAWEANMLGLAGRVSQGTIDELARMGPEGAPLVADLVNASDEELARLDAVFAERAGAATLAFADELTKAQPLLVAIGAQAGEGTADSIRAALAAGQTTIAQVMADYGYEIENGMVRPVEKAQTRIDGLTASLDRMDRRTIGVTIRYDEVLGTVVHRGAGMLGGNLLERAEGGWISGPGSGTSDSIPAMVSNGEFIVNARSAAQNKDLLEALNANRFAAGGWVSGSALPMPAPPAPATAGRAFIEGDVHLHGVGSRQDGMDRVHELTDLAFSNGWF